MPGMNLEGLDFVRIKKKSYTVVASIYPKDFSPTEIHDPVFGGDFIIGQGHERIVLCGTVGELWPITDEKFCKTYVTISGGKFTVSGLDEMVVSGVPQEISVRTSEGREVLWGVKVEEQGEVITSEGHRLLCNPEGFDHAGGDWVVAGDAEGKPDLNNCWVVNGKVFQGTYVIL